MRESYIEGRVRTYVKKIGGHCIKINQAGYPDRVIALPGGKTLYLELKAPGEKPRKLQWHRIKCLREIGHNAEYADDFELAKRMIDNVNDG